MSKTAIKLFKLAAGYSEDAQDKKQQITAYDNLAAAYMRKQDFLRDLAWNHVALGVKPENATAPRPCRRASLLHTRPRYSTKHPTGILKLGIQAIAEIRFA
jgi:hypothetical protein